MKYNLLKATKRILPSTIGCCIGVILAWFIDVIDTKKLIITLIGFLISFMVLTSISWVYECLKHKRKED